MQSKLHAPHAAAGYSVAAALVAVCSVVSSTQSVSQSVAVCLLE